MSLPYFYSKSTGFHNLVSNRKYPPGQVGECKQSAETDRRWQGLWFHNRKTGNRLSMCESRSLTSVHSCLPAILLWFYTVLHPHTAFLCFLDNCSERTTFRHRTLVRRLFTAWSTSLHNKQPFFLWIEADASFWWTCFLWISGVINTFGRSTFCMVFMDGLQ